MSRRNITRSKPLLITAHFKSAPSDRRGAGEIYQAAISRLREWARGKGAELEVIRGRIGRSGSIGSRERAQFSIVANAPGIAFKRPMRRAGWLMHQSSDRELMSLGIKTEDLS